MQDWNEIGALGSCNWLPGDQDKIVPAGDMCQLGVDCCSQDSFCPVACDCIADGFSGSNPDPDAIHVVGQVQ